MLLVVESFRDKLPFSKVELCLAIGASSVDCTRTVLSKSARAAFSLSTSCCRSSWCTRASCNSCLCFRLSSLISSSSWFARPSWVSASSFAARYSCLFSAALCLSFSRDLLSCVCSALRHEIWASRTLIRDKVWDKRSFTDRSLSSAAAAFDSASCKFHIDNYENIQLYMIS